MRGLFGGQGATEYLVLLAVVLIIALIGIALLGFFPGAASDAQIAESQIYWRSASPIAITEWDAKSRKDVSQGQNSITYLRVRNTGSYPVRITKMLGGNGQQISMFWNGVMFSIVDYFYMAPGEEQFFGWTTYGSDSYWPTLPSTKMVEIWVPGCSTGAQNALCAASSVCNAPNASTTGTLVVNNFGFEYIQYVEGQQITKRQTGAKPLIIKCTL